LSVDQRKDQAEVRAMLQVISCELVETRCVLSGALGKAISRQIHQPQAFVHREDVN
jgi:hypothetical protein